MNKQIQSDSDKPEFDSQDAPLTDMDIVKLADEHGMFSYNYTDAPQDYLLKYSRALLAQVKPKTDLGNDDNALAGSLDVPTECKSLPDLAKQRFASDWAKFLRDAIAGINVSPFVRLWEYEAGLIANHLEAYANTATWISADDRLPEEETPVLILRNGSHDLGELVWERPSFEETFQAFQFWDRPGDDGQGWEYDEITHWMPLPSAPTEPLYGASTEPRQAPQATCPKQDLDLCAPLSDKEPT